MTVEELTPEVLEEIQRGGSAVIEAWAVWCQPCRLISPIIEELAAEYSSQVPFYRFDAEKYPDLLGKLGILSIPTVLFIKNGKEIARTVGLVSRSVIEANVKKLLEAV